MPKVIMVIIGDYASVGDREMFIAVISMHSIAMQIQFHDKKREFNIESWTRVTGIRRRRRGLMVAISVRIDGMDAYRNILYGKATTIASMIDNNTIQKTSAGRYFPNGTDIREEIMSRVHAVFVKNAIKVP